MRLTLLTSAVVLGLALAAPALAHPMARHSPSRHHLIHSGKLNPATGARWGHKPGVGYSLPFSTHASNITPEDTHSVIAPRLPVPATENASPAQYLAWAREALAHGRSGLAQSNLEQAMTARLNDDEIRGGALANDPAIGVIQAALDNLAADRWQEVERRIAEALSHVQMAAVRREDGLVRDEFAR
jgi:hypothetical protein